MKTLTLTLAFIGLINCTFASQNKSQVKIRLQAQTGYLDETTIYFDFGTSPAYNYQEDAQKVVTGLIPNAPVLYSFTSDSVKCSTNGYGTLSASKDQIVALGCYVDTDGLYTFSSILIDNFDPTSIIRLEDRQLGILTDLRSDIYQVQLYKADTANGRFFIHISYPVQLSSVAPACSNNDGIISLMVDSSLTWTSCQLIDSSNTVVSSIDNVNSNVSFTSLREGDYQVLFVYGPYTTTHNIQLQGTAVLLTELKASSQYTVIDTDITFYAYAINATEYQWDFGDGTLIKGVANPTMSYYLPGNYTVSVKFSNDYGCVDSGQLGVKVAEEDVSGIKAENNNQDISIITLGKTITINMNDNTVDKADVHVFNLIGQSVYTNTIVAQKTDIALDAQPNGYYIVTVEVGGKRNSQKIFLRN